MKSSKFKKGDEVVIIDLKKYDTIVEVVEIHGWFYLYLFKSHSYPRSGDELEFAEVYESPLYKVLNEC